LNLAAQPNSLGQKVIEDEHANWSGTQNTDSTSSNRPLFFGCFRSGFAFAEEQMIVAQNGEARLRVFVEGNGSAIVLLPGQGRGPRDLDPLSVALASAGYRVLRPEPRGYGESVGPVDGVSLRDIATDVAAAIEATHAEPAIVGGWAYG